MLLVATVAVLAIAGLLVVVLVAIAAVIVAVVAACLETAATQMKSLASLVAAVPLVQAVALPCTALARSGQVGAEATRVRHFAVRCACKHRWCWGSLGPKQLQCGHCLAKEKWCFDLVDFLRCCAPSAAESQSKAASTIVQVHFTVITLQVAGGKSLRTANQIVCLEISRRNVDWWSDSFTCFLIVFMEHKVNHPR